MIFEALRELCPNCEYTVRDGVNIEWRSDPSLKPSDEEIEEYRAKKTKEA